MSSVAPVDTAPSDVPARSAMTETARAKTTRAQTVVPTPTLAAEMRDGLVDFLRACRRLARGRGGGGVTGTRGGQVGLLRTCRVCRAATRQLVLQAPRSSGLYPSRPGRYSGTPARFPSRGDAWTTSPDALMCADVSSRCLEAHRPVAPWRYHSGPSDLSSHQRLGAARGTWNKQATDITYLCVACVYCLNCWPASPTAADATPASLSANTQLLTLQTSRPGIS